MSSTLWFPETLMTPKRIAWVLVIVLLAGATISLRPSLEPFFQSSELKTISVVVNLDRNKDRLLRFMTEYSLSDLATKVPVRRFSAIDAKAIDISRFVTKSTLDQIHTTLLTGYRLRHHEMTIGAVGCFLSHISIMRMLLRDDTFDMYLVFEDDAIVPKTLYNRIVDAVKKAPQEWDMILFGYHYATYDASFTSPGYDKLETFWGTHAFAINKACAQKIVDDYKDNKIYIQIDSMLSLLVKRQHLKIYAPKKALVNPGHFGSDIQLPVKRTEGINPFDIDGSFLS
jgi:GR25 family glycosyltransferase involved in LPS biosynthesis